MRSHCDKVTHPLHGIPQGLAVLGQRFLALVALGEITGDLRVADKGARCVLQASDDDTRPKARAIFPHAPTLILEVPLLFDHLKLLLWPPAQDGLWRIEAGEMRTNYFVGFIAL